MQTINGSIHSGRLRYIEGKKEHKSPKKVRTLSDRHHHTMYKNTHIYLYTVRTYAHKKSFNTMDKSSFEHIFAIDSVFRTEKVQNTLIISETTNRVCSLSLSLNLSVSNRIECVFVCIKRMKCNKTRFPL